MTKISGEQIEILNENLELALTGSDSAPRQSAIATSELGEYHAANIDSQTKLLHITAEQVALVLSTQRKDYGINQVIAMHEDIPVGCLIEPIAQLVMADYVRRTGRKIKYTLVDGEGEIVFETPDISLVNSLYQPAVSTDPQFKKRIPFSNQFEVSEHSEGELKRLAVHGLSRSFTTYPGASSYGAVAVNANNEAFISGQYSSFEGRTNVHAEMAAVICALMTSKSDIVKVGVVSEKHTDVPCEVCGCCRQFLSEISAQFEQDIEVHRFAFDSDKHNIDSLATYLPSAWSSK